MKLDAVLDALSAEDAALLRDAVATLPAERVAAALRLVGHDVHASSVKRWRERNGSR